MAFLKGKKTYLAGAVMILVSVGSIVLGDLDANTGIQRIIEGASIIFLRAGISKG